MVGAKAPEGGRSPKPGGVYVVSVARQRLGVWRPSAAFFERWRNSFSSLSQPQAWQCTPLLSWLVFGKSPWFALRDLGAAAHAHQSTGDFFNCELPLTLSRPGNKFFSTVPNPVQCSWGFPSQMETPSIFRLIPLPKPCEFGRVKFNSSELLCPFYEDSSSLLDRVGGGTFLILNP